MKDIKSFLIKNSHKVPAVFQFAKFSKEITNSKQPTIVKRVKDKVSNTTISIAPFYKDITRHL